MREIEFRGICAESGQWVFGFLLVGSKSYILHTDFVIAGYKISVPSSFVKEETVGQFTGLRDKNGKKIFEGDVVYINGFDFPRVIEHHSGGFGFFLNESRLVFMRLGCADDINMLDTVVVGNIHENPELLEAI